MASKTEARQPAVKASLAALASQSPSAKPDRGNAFLGNLYSSAPIYAVYGPGTSSDGRVQIRFKYPLVGTPGAVGGDNALHDGIHFAHTPRYYGVLVSGFQPIAKYNKF